MIQPERIQPLNPKTPDKEIDRIAQEQIWYNVRCEVTLWRQDG